MRLRLPNAVEVTYAGLIMCVGSIAMWFLLEIYEARHEILELGVDIVAVAMNWPYGTLKVIGVTGFVMLYFGVAILTNVGSVNHGDI